MSKMVDMTGKKFGQLTVVKFSHTKNKKAYWECTCDCGSTCVKSGQDVRRGHTKSCGCLIVDKATAESTIHGMSGTPTYESWRCMLQRCYNPKTNRYKAYGARGITVCDEWKTFAGFFNDMGLRPAGSSIDRINVNGNYCKENCRWATNEQQFANKTDNHYLTLNNETKTIAQWRDVTGLTRSTITGRLSNGWTIEQTLTTPSLLPISRMKSKHGD